MRYITFALAKGRLAKKAMALLEEIGITCDIRSIRLEIWSLQDVCVRTQRSEEIFKQ